MTQTTWSRVLINTGTLKIHKPYLCTSPALLCMTLAHLIHPASFGLISVLALKPVVPNLF